MKVINFARRFKEPLQRGSKTATVRQEEKVEHMEPFQIMCDGDVGEAVCLCVHPVFMDRQETIYIGQANAKLDNKDIARRCGFDSPGELFRFYDENYGLPFQGYIHFFKMI